MLSSTQNVDGHIQEYKVKSSFLHLVVCSEDNNGQRYPLIKEHHSLLSRRRREHLLAFEICNKYRQNENVKSEKYVFKLGNVIIITFLCSIFIAVLALEVGRMKRQAFLHVLGLVFWAVTYLGACPGFQYFSVEQIFLKIL